MRLVCQQIRTLLLLLFAAVGPVATLAAPGDWTRVSYPVVSQGLSAQPFNLTNSARAPPHTSANVMATGTALAQTGNLRVFDGAATTGAVYAFLWPSIAPNAGTRPDFYVSPNGEAVEGTLYRYSDSAYADDILQNSGSPGIDGRGHYLGTEALGSASSVRDRYQIAPEWSNPTVRGELDSIQLYDPNTGTWRLQTPTSNGNTTTIPEPYTSAYPEYGTGGARQYITDQNTSFRYDNVDIIGD